MCFILKSFSRTLGKNSLIVARRECAPWQPQGGIGDDREKVPSCHGTAHLLLWGKISPPTPRGTVPAAPQMGCGHTERHAHQGLGGMGARLSGVKQLLSLTQQRTVLGIYFCRLLWDRHLWRLTPMCKRWDESSSSAAASTAGCSWEQIFRLKSGGPYCGLMLFGSIPILLKSVAEKTYFAHWSEQSSSELL